MANGFPTQEMTMVRRLIILGLLALSAAAPGVFAQTAAAPAAAAPTANPVDPAAVQALKDMGAYLQTLKRFQVSTEATGERVLADGQKLQRLASAKLDVVRPNRLRVTMKTAQSQRDLVYDGKAVTLYAPAQKYYSTVEFSDTIGALIDRLEAKYGVELPLEDLFRWNDGAEDRIKSLRSAYKVGTATIDGAETDHYAFREDDVDWEVWIQQGDQPFPRKLVIVVLLTGGRPAIGPQAAAVAGQVYKGLSAQNYYVKTHALAPASMISTQICCTQ
jgi:hypothetical protein